jgi:hypothetical protein
MNRTATITLIIILIAANMTAMQLSSAASTPSVPEFTVKQVDRSYDAPTTYTTNPYTGETITHQGYRVTNRTIEVIIKNQPIPTSTNGYNTTGLFYNVQAKYHGDDWSSGYNDIRNKYTVKPSSSDHTVVTYALNSDEWHASSGEQVDIRVQAVTGTEYYVFSMGGGALPIGTQFILDKASSWSSIQTITVGSGEVTTNKPTTQPTQNPTAAPTQANTETPTQPEVASGLAWKDIVIVAAFTVIAVLAAALVLTRRKKQ